MSCKPCCWRGRWWITGVHLGFESPVCVCFKGNATPPQNLDIHLQTSYKGRTDFRSSEQTERSLAILKQKFLYFVTGARQTQITSPQSCWTSAAWMHGIQRCCTFISFFVWENIWYCIMSVDILLQNDVLLLSKGAHSLERQMHLKWTWLTWNHKYSFVWKTSFTTKILFAKVIYSSFRQAETDPNAVFSKYGAQVGPVMKVCSVEAQMKGRWCCLTMRPSYSINHFRKTNSICVLDASVLVSTVELA